MRPSPRPRRRAFDISAVAIFLLAVGLPLYGLLFRTPGPLDENRDRYTFPAISTKRYALQAFPKHFEMYLGDRIGYREVLLRWQRQLVNGVLDEPVTKEAWVGKDGWIFINQSDPLGGNPKHPSPAARVDRWIEAFEERNAWLKSQGIEYIVVFAPDKAAVYPEHLRGYPARHPPLEMATPAAKILNERGVRCVNMLPAILTEKPSNPHPLYHKTDSHWTHDGARAGYKELSAAVAELFPEFRMQSDSGYDFGTRVFGGDLRKIAGVAADQPPEEVRIWHPRSTITIADAPDYFAVGQREEHLTHIKSTTANQPAATGPETLVLQDSFGDHLLGFIWNDFRHVTRIGTYGMPLEAVRREKPRLVIQILVARQLYWLGPVNPPEVKAAR